MIRLTPPTAGFTLLILAISTVASGTGASGQEVAFSSSWMSSGQSPHDFQASCEDRYDLYADVRLQVTEEGPAQRFPSVPSHARGAAPPPDAQLWADWAPERGMSGAGVSCSGGASGVPCSSHRDWPPQDCDWPPQECGGASGLEFGGWLAWGGYLNSHGLGANGNQPLGFNNLAQQFQLNQAWFYAGKTADNGGSGFAWGFRVDALFGTDGPDTVAFGDGSWDASGQTSNQYGAAVPQLYLELAIGQWLVRVGHFYTIIGYEVVQAPDNFFYSHAYTFYYNEPFTHTGVLAERALTEQVTAYLGWTAGWDSGFENRNDGSTFLGGVRLRLSDRAELLYATSFGDPGDDRLTSSETYLHSLVLDWDLGRGWNCVCQSDFQSRRSNQLGGESYGVNSSLTKELREGMAAGLRYEWFRDKREADAIAGDSQRLQAITLGLNMQTGQHSILKPEIRYDWVDGAARPFAKQTKRSQFTWGFQSIYNF